MPGSHRAATTSICLVCGPLLRVIHLMIGYAASSEMFGEPGWQKPGLLHATLAPIG